MNLATAVAARVRLRPHHGVMLGLGAAAVLLLVWGEPDRALASAIEGLDRAYRDAAGWIAELGESKWYLYPAAAAFAVAALGRRWIRRGNARAAWDWMTGAVGFLFLSLALSGIVVNLVKWTIGRARPNLFTREQIYLFEPFSFDARFHSFPSGHVNTLIVLGLVAGFLLPRLRVHLIVAATLLALSRVGENAHYFSDFLGGAAIAVGTTYWLRARLAERDWVFTRAGGDLRVNRRGRLVGRWLRRRARRWRTPPAAAGRLSVSAPGRER